LPLCCLRLLSCLCLFKLVFLYSHRLFLCTVSRLVFALSCFCLVCLSVLDSSGNEQSSSRGLMLGFGTRWEKVFFIHGLDLGS
jgi:hypothetical protein